MAAELERRRIASQQFSADIAHELNTPLSVIRGTLEAMQDGTLPATPERLARLQVQAGQVQHIAADLRLLSMADAGDLTLRPESLRADHLLEELAGAFSEAADRQGVTLHAPPLHAHAPPLTVQADPLRLGQILGNLLQNALNHTPAGGRVTLTASALSFSDDGAPGELAVTVQDTGCGIPAHQLPLVFDRLYRADPSRSRPGSGLGLSIARTLAEAHGGRLTLTSVPGQGTTATLTLPLSSTS
ncbi:hypothetical protein GCM10008961_16650 [Deinococcus knuensis]|uniref:histidine kinase n=2 Tax=Deinococcus knuensis TaxID=1837380 RepID=A0ABQ2SGZ4_9DEIO|nr:hypothetical protein GCM10008961_16650 [Deinococcus knuensis]